MSLRFLQILLKKGSHMKLFLYLKYFLELYREIMMLWKSAF